ncbi:MAG: efflux RND transporter permease subunit [Acidobacteria bacterium]|nr:efflux RND transporter permease subunit [Acidobacteriota bacterium]
MLERVIGWTLKQRGLVLLGVALLAVFGVHAGMNLPMDAFPDVTNVQVEILGDAPGLSALEVERFVTYPVESALRGLPGVVQMRSVTKFGLSVVTLVFADDVDIYFARQLVFERLEEARAGMPGSVSVGMGPIATAMGEIYQYTLQGPAPSDPAGRVRRLTELRTLQEWVVAPLLKGVAGVSEINSFGGYFKQYQVLVDPAKLVAHDLSLDAVRRAIERNNRNAGGGTLDRFDEQYIVRGVGLLRSVEDIGNIVLAAHRGTPVSIRDVAEVRVGEAVRQGAALLGGEGETVGGIVMMLRGENGREVVGRVKAKVREINESGILPAGVRLAPYYDRSDMVSASVGTVTRALAEGSALVLVVLFLLLGSLRSAAVVILALPLSLLLTFIVMRQAGIDANLMSLGGLAISIGMIIDATIIQVENVQRRLGENPGPGARHRTVLKAVLEVRKPSIFGELIIATTFLPILSLQGLEGKMFGPLALTVVVALLASLLLSIFVIPAMCALVLRPGPEKESAVMRGAGAVYEPLLGWALRRKRWILSGACAALLAAVFLSLRLGTEFIPVMDEGAFDMDVQLMPGITLDKALDITGLVHERLRAFPELTTLISRTGQTGIALEARGVDKTGFTGMLKPRSEWETASSRAELTGRMRAALSGIPGMDFSFSQPIQCRIDELVAGTRAQLIVKLFGEDLEILEAKAGEIGAVLGGIPGTADLVVERIDGQPYLSIDIDRGAIARHALDAGDVLGIVEMSVAGMSAGTLYEENRAFDVVVRYPGRYRESAAAIGNALVPAPGGYNLPLSQLAAISVAPGPVQISRENGLRRIGVEVNIHGRDIGSYVAEAREAIREKVVLPPGFHTSWGGQFENQQRAMRRMMIVGPLGVGLILFLLFVTFGSVRLALLVLCNLPFALIGGVFGLQLAGLYLSVPASIGFIVLFGVAVLNGVVLVSRITQLRQAGLSVEEAVFSGSRSRLRPVLMTASIAIFSLIPMLAAAGPGSEVQRPLAVVVVGGLVTSTVLTLVLLPALYGWFARGPREGPLPSGGNHFPSISGTKLL